MRSRGSLWKWGHCLLVLLCLIFSQQETVASHAMGVDLTYQCVGTDSFLVTLSFYRDCDGILGPSTGKIVITSASCSGYFIKYLPLLVVNDLATVCDALTSSCDGGAYPGAEEYVYQDLIILPSQCSDWKFSYDQCCRNNAISTIDDPAGERVYVEALVDNTGGTCNASPVFSNTPIPFICVGKTYCFNNGATDEDGDSLSYELVTPTTGMGAADTVTYLAGYSYGQPLLSSPGVTIDQATGDICISPTLLGEVSVMQVRVNEYRNGAFIGYVERDIQIRVVNCPGNELPFLDGIDGTGSYTQTICANKAYSFITNSADLNSTDSVSLTWSQSILGASFDISAGSRPIGTFSWTPSTSDVRSAPYCFTTEVRDNFCPYNGSEIKSFCLTVVGIEASITNTTDLSCYTDCDGTATVVGVGGVSPYSYAWNDINSQTSQTAIGLCSGSLFVTLTDASGCGVALDTLLTSPQRLIPDIATYNNISCFSGSDGSVTAAVSGGVSPYLYTWSSGESTQLAAGLVAGTYTITITDDTLCSADTTVSLVQPAGPLVGSTMSTPCSCNGGADGTTLAAAIGGTGTYSYLWDAATGNQTTVGATGLIAGTYTVTVTDENGCEASSTIAVSEPSIPLILTTSFVPFSCYGGSDASASIAVSGGVSPYSYLWDAQAGGGTASTVNNLSALTYTVTVTDGGSCVKIASQTITGPTATYITALVNSASCGLPNGDIALTGMGGTSGYTFLWNDASTEVTLSGLASGIYAVTMTDSQSCILDTSVIVNNLQPDLVISDTTHLSCYGQAIGSANISASAGLTPYIFIWDDGQTDSTGVSLSGGAHYVSVTDQSGCLAIMIVNINEPTELLVTLLQDSVSCTSKSDGSATIVTIGGVTPYAYLWGASTDFQNTPTASGIYAGIHNISLSDNNGCLIDTFQTVFEPDSLQASLLVANTSCFQIADGMISSIASGGTTPYTYLWEASAGGGASAAVTGLLSGTYAITISDTKGCERVDDAEIIEPALIQVDSTLINVSCSGGGDGIVGLTIIGGTTPYTFQWDDAGNQTSQSATGLSIGTYAVTIMDLNGCLEMTQATLTEPVLLSITSSFSNVSCYSGNDAFAVVTPTGGTTPYTFSWNDGNLQSTATASALIAGIYKVTILDANLCLDTVTTVIAEPDTGLYFNVSITDVTCFLDSNGSAVVDVSGGTSPYLYQWDSSADSSQTSSVVGLKQGTYVLTVTDANGCVNISSHTVIEPTLLWTTPGVLDVSCYGYSDGQISLNTIGGTGPYSYLWGTLAGSVTTSSAFALAAGSYSVTISDALGCKFDTIGIVSQSGEFFDQPVVTNVSCKGGADGVVTISPTGGTSPYNYVWSNFSQITSTATGLIIGTYSYSVSDDNGCQIIRDVSIGEPDSLIVVTSLSDTICPGDNTTLQGFASGGNGDYSYAWSGLVDSSQSVSLLPLESTWYVLSVTDILGCVGVSSSVYIAVSVLDLENLELFAGSSICAGESTTVSALYNEAFGPYTYNWSSGLGSGAGPIVISPDATQYYVVTCTDFCGAEVVDSLQIVVNPQPQVTLPSLIGSGCAPYSIQVSNQIDDPLITSWLWDFGDGFVSTEVSPIHTFAAFGDYLISVEVETAVGCAVTVDPQGIVSVFDVPTAGFALSPKRTNMDQPEATVTDQSIGGLSYLWSFGDGGESTDQSLLYSYSDTGSYQVVQYVYNEHGCMDSAVSAIIIDPVIKIAIPNAFKPDPSGPNGGQYDLGNIQNDIFFAVTDYVVDFRMQVYNRWGEIVFESYDVKIGWDGYYRDKLCQQDKYIWKIGIKYIDGSQYFDTGEILLIR